MKISFENPDKVNGLLTLTVEEADYKENVEKTLKSYRKKANIPGFRPGQVPMSLVKRQFGASVKMDEINKRSHWFIVAKFCILMIAAILFGIGLSLKIALV